MLRECLISELRDSVMCCPLAPAGYALLAESFSWLHYKSCILFLACTHLYNYCYFRIGKMKIPSILWVSLDWLYSSAKTLIFPQLKDMINLVFFLLYVYIYIPSPQLSVSILSTNSILYSIYKLPPYIIYWASPQ